MATIKLVTEMQELEGIRQLQRANLSSLISAEEAASEGFVTAEYSFDFLKVMHDAAPSIIAKDADEVVGYALVADKAIRNEHALLADLFNTIDSLQYNGKTLQESDYVVVGQLCVAKSHRGIGLADDMYQFYRAAYSSKYACCITDIAQSNPRSLKAHLKTGFTVFATLNYGGIAWDVVIWDWNAQRD